jgi:hypothetical protein
VSEREYHIERFGSLPIEDDARLSRIEAALYREFRSDVDGTTGLARCIDLGRDGWELMTIFPDSGQLVAIFKRPVG